MKIDIYDKSINRVFDTVIAFFNHKNEEVFNAYRKEILNSSIERKCSFLAYYYEPICNTANDLKGIAGEFEFLKRESLANEKSNKENSKTKEINSKENSTKEKSCSRYGVGGSKGKTRRSAR